MATTNEEMMQLVNYDRKKTTANTNISRAVTTFKIINAIPRGASSWASTFGPIAIHYKPGLWLIAPVASGSIISLTNEAVTVLAKQYPDNKFLGALNSGTFFTDYGMGGFFADFGFAWSMITTIGIYAGGVEYYSNSFGKIMAPALALLPSIASRTINYTNAKNPARDQSLVGHASSLFRGAIAPSAVLTLLLQQKIIPIDSPIPTAVIATSGLLALLASLFKERSPTISKTLMAIVNLICENPSLAAACFHFPNDIYAANNDNAVNEEFFYTNVGVTGVFLTLLTLISLTNLFMPSQNIQEIASNDDDSSEEYQSTEEESSEESEEVEEIMDVEKAEGTAVNNSDIDSLLKLGIYSSINSEASDIIAMSSAKSGFAG